MNISSIISVIDDHGFADETTTRKLDVINDVIWDICSREPWPFMEKSVTLAFDGTNANPSNYPTDVATITGVVDPASGVSLYPIRLDEFRHRYASVLSTSGTPFYYYFIAEQMYVYPIPPSNQTLLMSYLFFPDAVEGDSVEADIALPARFHSIIWLGALLQLYDMEDDLEMSTRFEQKFERKFQTMRNQLWMRQTDKADTIEISDNEDVYS